MKQQIIVLLEGKKEQCDICENRECHDTDFNKGIDTAIESVDEILGLVVEMIEDELPVKYDEDYAREHDREKGFNDCLSEVKEILNKLKQ